jgi:hypothetical protein
MAVHWEMHEARKTAVCAQLEVEADQASVAMCDEIDQIGRVLPGGGAGVAVGRHGTTWC